MIIRTTHDKNNPYYIKARGCVENKSLSWKAKGIHDYLMSKPDGWEISIENLINASSDGAAATRSGVQELIDCGFMMRVRVTDKSGKVTGWELHAYELSQKPDIDFRNVDNPDRGFPDRGFPDVENRTLVIKETTVTNEKEESNSFSAKKLQRQKQKQLTEKQPTATESVTEKETLTPSAAAPLPLATEPAQPTEQQRKFQLLCNIVGWDYKLLTKEQQGQVAQTLGILTRAGYTEEHLKQFHDQVWAKDWRWQQHHSYPSLAQVRAEMGKLKLQQQVAATRTAAAAVEQQTAIPQMLRMQQRKGFYTQ